MGLHHANINRVRLRAATRRGNYTKSGRGGEGHKLELSAALETSASVTHKSRRSDDDGRAADEDFVGQRQFQVLISKIDESLDGGEDSKSRRMIKGEFQKCYNFCHRRILSCQNVANKTLSIQ